MEKNFLITGPPGCGKTTALIRLSEALRAAGYTVGGIICPEIREGGSRVGFEIVDILGRRGILAHTRLVGQGRPSVSRYGVSLADLTEITKEAFSRKADVFIVDEIGPMELKSTTFVTEVHRALDSTVPLVAAVHYRTTKGFVGEVKGRADTRVIRMGVDNRNEIPAILHAQLASLIRRHI